jgi:hypothetical protein
VRKRTRGTIKERDQIRLKKKDMKSEDQRNMKTGVRQIKGSREMINQRKRIKIMRHTKQNKTRNRR